MNLESGSLLIAFRNEFLSKNISTHSAARLYNLHADLKAELLLHSRRQIFSFMNSGLRVNLVILKNLSWFLRLIEEVRPVIRS